MNTASDTLNPINQPAGELVTEIDGEPVLAYAQLHEDSYSCYRICACAGLGAAVYGIGSLIALPYALCGGSCRKEEERKMVPLEKVQDVALSASCCADCCGYVPPGTKYFKLEIQTAGASGPKQTGAEIQAVALRDPERFRSSVLAARRVLNGRGTDADKALLQYPEAVFGEGKSPGDSAASLGAAAAAAAGSSVRAGDVKVVALLERIGDLLEQVVENGSTGAK